MRFIIIFIFLVLKLELTILVEATDYFSLSCPSPTLINIINISAIKIQLEFTDSRSKCFSILILLEAFKKRCNFKTTCKTNKKILKEALKLCPETNFDLIYECIVGNKTCHQKPSNLLYSFLCLNNQINVGEVTPFNSIKSKSIEENECPDREKLKKTLTLQCHGKSKCFLNKKSFSCLKNSCNASYIGVNLKCRPFPKNEFNPLSSESEFKTNYQLSCLKWQFIRSIKVHPLEYGSKHSLVGCDQIGNLEEVLNSTCLKRMKCYINNHLIDEVKRSCLHVHHVFVEYVCERWNESSTNQLECNGGDVLDVKLKIYKIKNSFVSLSLKAYEIFSTFRKRCLFRDKCHITDEEIDQINNEMSMKKSQSTISFSCTEIENKNSFVQKTVEVCDDESIMKCCVDWKGVDAFKKLTGKTARIRFKLKKMERLYQKNYSTSKNVSTKNNTKKRIPKKCISLRSKGILNWRTMHLGRWQISGQFNTKRNIENFVNRIKKKLMISFGRHFTPVVSEHTNLSQEAVENTCSLGKDCNSFILKNPFYRVENKSENIKNDTELLQEIKEYERISNLKPLDAFLNRHKRSAESDLPKLFNKNFKLNIFTKISN